MVCLTMSSGCRLHVDVTLANPNSPRAPICPAAVVLYPVNANLDTASVAVGEVSFWWPPDMVQPRQALFEQKLREAAARSGATRAIVGWDSLVSPAKRFSSLVYVASDSDRVSRVCTAQRTTLGAPAA